MKAGRPGPRRHAIAAPDRRPNGSALAAGALVVLAVAAVLLTPSTPALEHANKITAGALVTHSLTACPDVHQAKAAKPRFVVGSVPKAGLGSAGTVRAGDVGSGGSSLGISRGQLVEVPTTDGRAPMLQADGQIAAGLFGFRIDSGSTLAAAACSAPRASWWFTGAGAALDHTSTLVMTNADPGPAVVDVRIYGPDGPVDTIGTRGITVAPGTSQTLNLAGVAPQTDEMAVHIQASRGRIVAAVADEFALRAGAASGSEWLPDQTLASRVVRLAGLPQKATSRTLLIANPSDLEAIVEVQVAGGSGAFTPSGLGEIQVAPGTVSSTDLTSAVGDEAVAVRLRSRVPVTATVRSTRSGDTTYAAPVVPLVGPAAAPVIRGTDSTVELTAGELEARAAVRSYDADGRYVDGQQLLIRPRTTSTWSPSKRAAYVVVTPEKGSIYGAVSLTGPGLSQVPLLASPIRFQRPKVFPASG